MNQISILPKRHEKPWRQLAERHGSPLLVLDCDVLRQSYRELKHALPGVDFYYAIKSLPATAALQTLAGEGAGFDVATSGELELLRDIDAAPLATIHTHPVKRDQDIRDALKFGCSTFVVDNRDELLKFRAFAGQVELLLRVSFRGKDAKVDLSRKFGCGLQHIQHLLNAAAALGICIKGLSFHVGSQSLSSAAHVNAINACRTFYSSLEDPEAGHLTVLDIGGGFPVDYSRQGFDLEAFCQPINAALGEYPAHVRIIAEPGRVLSAPAITSISTILGRAERAGLWWYYLDDGVYGAFSGQIYDHTHYPLSVFSDEPAVQPSVLAGPTCDSIDVVTESAMLPAMNIGDIVVGEMMGAYTWATAGEFNSIPKPKLLAINVEERTTAHRAERAG
ncbi:MAG TPA: type III PLP-dependent enzyme [Xanthomonadales bacterium]|nr:type III PLP-dependent enzyme [Xanthomonadales bacterium]